jgi:mitochondrial fission protein ELM1
MQPSSSACWVISDGRRGIENQALGLAEAMAQQTPLKLGVQT